MRSCDVLCGMDCPVWGEPAEVRFAVYDALTFGAIEQTAQPVAARVALTERGLGITEDRVQAVATAAWRHIQGDCPKDRQ